MVHTKNQYYYFFSPNYLDGDYTNDFELVVDINEAFKPILALNTSRRFYILEVNMFYEIENNP